MVEIEGLSPKTGRLPKAVNTKQSTSTPFSGPPNCTITYFLPVLFPWKK